MPEENKPEGQPAEPAAAPPSASSESKPASPEPVKADPPQPAAPPAEKPAAPSVAKPTAPPADKPAAPPAAKPAAPAAAKPATPAPPKPPAVMVTTPWEDDLSAEIKERFGAEVTETVSYLGQQFLVVKPAAVIPVLEFLKLEADFDYLVDITAVDWPKRAERFDVVYILYSFARNLRIRVKTYIPDGFRPPSAVPVHLTANWLEREVYDMFGIEFEGHPDMRRILMPDEWDGYPLRKDYSILKQDERWVKENLGIESAQ